MQIADAKTINTFRLGICHQILIKEKPAYFSTSGHCQASRLVLHIDCPIIYYGRDHERLTLNKQVCGLAHSDSILSHSLVNSKHFSAAHVQLDACFDYGCGNGDDMLKVNRPHHQLQAKVEGLWPWFVELAKLSSQMNVQSTQVLIRVTGAAVAYGDLLICESW